MSGQVISDLKVTKRDFKNKSKGWFKFTTDKTASVSVDTENPRNANCWNCFRDNVPSTDCGSYYPLSIAILVMDNLINNVEGRLSNRKYTEIFSIFPSVCLLEQS